MFTVEEFSCPTVTYGMSWISFVVAVVICDRSRLAHEPGRPQTNGRNPPRDWNAADWSHDADTAALDARADAGPDRPDRAGHGCQQRARLRQRAGLGRQR